MNTSITTTAKATLVLTLALSLSGLVGGCDQPSSSDDPGENPFLDPLGPDDGKTDTGWVTGIDAVEVELTLEGEVVVDSSWRARTAPADQAQFALTYFRRNSKLFVETLLVDGEIPRTIEWWIDGQWVDASEVDPSSYESLSRYRIRGVSAVVVDPEDLGSLNGRTFSAIVPRNPTGLYRQVGSRCARSSSHLYDSTYWYYWDPNQSSCDADVTNLTATVDEVFTTTATRYPEYDQLIEDGEVSAIVFFGRVSHSGDVEDDPNFRTMDSFIRMMEGAGFTAEASPLGLRRYVRETNGIRQVIDISSPADFEGLDDTAHVDVFDEGIRTHEIVMYNGHSILGSSRFWSRDGIYPDFYQIFFFNGCLGYEYYVAPILEGKGDWSKVDVISNVMPTPSGPQASVLAAALAAILEGTTNGGETDWGEIIRAIQARTYNSYYGVSGARTNCFSPGGSLCGESEPSEEAHRYESTAPADIPDNDPDGVDSVIDVPDSFLVGSLAVEVNIRHEWINDLVVTLSHGDRSVTLWNRAGGNGHFIHETFTVTEFDGMEAGGAWTLHVEDRGANDTGTLDDWALSITPAE